MDEITPLPLQDLRTIFLRNKENLSTYYPTRIVLFITQCVCNSDRA